MPPQDTLAPPPTETAVPASAVKPIETEPPASLTPPAPSPDAMPDVTQTPAPAITLTPTVTPSPTAKPAPSPSPTPVPTPKPPSVTVSVDTPDGPLLDAAEIPFTDGMTAEQALRAACETADLELKVRAPGTRRAYIAAIGGLAEFDRGPGSGWMYLHNGENVSQGVGARIVTEGDALVFWYTLEYGKELTE